MIENQVKNKSRLTRQWLIITVVAVVISLLVGRWLAENTKGQGWQFSGISTDNQGYIFATGSDVVRRFDSNGQIVAQIPINDISRPAFDQQGNIFGQSNCADLTSSYCVKKYNVNGQLITKFSNVKDDAAIIAVATDRQGNYYTVKYDVGFTPIEKYDNNGQHLETWNKDKPGQKVMNFGFTSDNILYVLIRGSSNTAPTLEKYDASGKLTITLLLRDLTPYAGDYSDFAVDTQGNFYVGRIDYDANDFKIYKFSPQGQLLAKWSVERSYKSDFDRIAVDNQGNVYVRTDVQTGQSGSDFFNKIDKYDGNGHLLATWQKDGDWGYWVWWFAPALIVLLIAGWQLVRPAKPQPLPDKAFE